MTNHFQFWMTSNHMVDHLIDGITQTYIDVVTFWKSIPEADFHFSTIHFCPFNICISIKLGTTRLALSGITIIIDSKHECVILSSVH